MTHAPLPTKKLSDGRTLPCLGMGTWLMGGDTQKNVSPQNDVDVAALRYAIDLGLTHIDTAEIYGNGFAEELVAQAIKPYPRADLFIATKAKQGHHGKTSLRQALEGSLQRLQTDYIDLYYLHAPTLETPFEETAAALNAAYSQGLIKHVGVSNFAHETLQKLQSFLEPRILVNQVHYNLAFREPALSGLLHDAQTHDYFIMAWRPLSFVKRKVTDPTVKHNAWDAGAFPLLDAMAEKYQKTTAQVALAWLLDQKNVCALVKASNPAHLDEIVDSFFEWDPADHQQLSAEFAPQYARSDVIPLV